MRALLVAAWLASGCNLVIDESRHVRPEPPERGMSCATDDDCAGPGMFCESRSCTPCWGTTSNLQFDDLAADLDVATVYDESDPGALVAFTAWAGVQLGSAFLVEMPVRYADHRPEFTGGTPEPLPPLLDGMSRVSHVAMTRTVAPPTIPGGRIVPVLAALGFGPDGEPAIWVGHLRPTLDGDFIPLAPGTELLGPIAVTPYLNTEEDPVPMDATRPVAYVVWRERVGGVTRLNGYLAAHERPWPGITIERLVDTEPGFFLEGAGGSAMIYGPDRGDALGIFDPGFPGGVAEVPTPDRHGPGAIARLGDQVYTFAYPMRGPRVGIGEVSCNAGCMVNRDIDGTIYREGDEVSAIAMTPSPVSPLLVLEHTRYLGDRRENLMRALALVRGDDYRPGYMPGSGVDAFMGHDEESPAESIALSQPIYGESYEWASTLAVQRENQVTTFMMRGCGSSPGDLRDGS